MSQYRRRGRRSRGLCERMGGVRRLVDSTTGSEEVCHWVLKFDDLDVGDCRIWFE